MTAGPQASASGERLMIARGIEAGWPRRLGGSVHKSPVRHLPHAPKQKARKTKFPGLGVCASEIRTNLELPPLRIPAMCYRPERMTDETIRRSGRHFHADDK
jgi:hypothetical protein